MARKHEMFRVSTVLVAVYGACVAIGLSPSRAGAHPLSQALIELSESPENLLVGSPGLLAVEEVHLDINSDGLLGADDIDAWYDGLVVEEVNDDLEILWYEYSLRKDVNRDGVVNVLDGSLLRIRIAYKFAEQGGMLVWRGEPVNSSVSPIYYNGVHVVSMFDAGFMLGEVELEGPVEQEECPSVLINDSGWSDPEECATKVWHQSAIACGNIVPFRGQIELCEGAYGTKSVVFQCGETGPKPMQVMPKQTTHSTLRGCVKSHSILV